MRDRYAVGHHHAGGLVGRGGGRGRVRGRAGRAAGGAIRGRVVVAASNGESSGDGRGAEEERGAVTYATLRRARNGRDDASTAERASGLGGLHVASTGRARIELQEAPPEVKGEHRGSTGTSTSTSTTTATSTGTSTSTAPTASTTPRTSTSTTPRTSTSTAPTASTTPRTSTSTRQRLRPRPHRCRDPSDGSALQAIDPKSIARRGTHMGGGGGTSCVFAAP